MARKPKAPDNSEETEPHYSQILERLEEIVATMENQELELEDSLSLFEEGVKLTREAQKALAAAEQKVRLLTEEDGEMIIAEFDEPEED